MSHLRRGGGKTVNPRLSPSVSVPPLGSNIVEFFKTNTRQQVRLKIFDDMILHIVNGLDGARDVEEISAECVSRSVLRLFCLARYPSVAGVDVIAVNPCACCHGARRLQVVPRSAGLVPAGLHGPARDAFCRGDGCWGVGSGRWALGDVCGWRRGRWGGLRGVSLRCVRFAFGGIIRKGQRRRLRQNDESHGYSGNRKSDQESDWPIETTFRDHCEASSLGACAPNGFYRYAACRY